MAMSKHTPAPWRMARMERPPIGRQPNGEPWPTDANGNVFWGYSISGSSENGAAILPTLAAVHNFPDQVEANARLIVAAPEMLAALKEMEAADDISSVAKALKSGLAAIAKAEGRS